MKTWKIEHCSERPSKLQVIADNFYMQRRNIHEVHHEESDEMAEYTDWECESREITFDEYEQLKELMEENEKLRIEFQSKMDYLAIMTDTEIPE